MGKAGDVDDFPHVPTTSRPSTSSGASTGGGAGGGSSLLKPQKDAKASQVPHAQTSTDSNWIKHLLVFALSDIYVDVGYNFVCMLIN